MPPRTYITVTAPPGRNTPIHANDGRDPGGGVLLVDDASVVRVALSQDIRRSITRGDLIPCDMNGAHVASADLAAAPDDLPGGMVRIERKKGLTK